jgi:integrase
MGRPAKGSVAWNPRASAWEVRVTLPTGARSKPIAMTGLPPCMVSPKAPAKGCACEACANAEANGQKVSRRMRDGAAVDAATSETVSEWFDRYYQAAERGAVGRKNRGKPQASVDDRRSMFRNWIEPTIGTKPMTSIANADLRAVVRKLDEQVLLRIRFYSEAEESSEATPRKGRKPGLSGKTAGNVWSEITNGFGEATNSKLDELRVLERNPAEGVMGPTTTEDREQAALYPAEIVTLLSCADILRERRRVYFVALYTGMRRSELERLTAADVDMVHGLITVRGKKTNAAKRQIPIEPALAPLLSRLVKARKAGPLLVVPRADGKGGASDVTKKDLERAKIDREALLLDDAEHMPFTFHGMRHTAITHWAVAGRDPKWLLIVAGHTDEEMTRRYLDKAAVVRNAFGAPHPMLPQDVVDDLLVGLETTADEIEVPSEAAPEFWQSIGFLADGDKSKAGNPSGLPAVLTSLWRPQRESNPRYRRERPMS